MSIKLKLSAEQAQAERDALVMSAAQAHTVAEHFAVLDASSALEQAEQAIDSINALSTARMRGAAIYGAYALTIAARGGKAEPPISTDFAAVREALKIPDRPAKGEQGTPWHGMAYSTIEQAYAFHQFSPEDGWREQAYERFLSAADAEQVKYLGSRPSSLIGRLNFARRVARGADGIVVPTSGTAAARRDALVEQVITAANGKIADRGAAATEASKVRRVLIERADAGSLVPLVTGVAGLTCGTAGQWTDEQITAVISALNALKSRPRVETAAPAQAEQAEQVTAVSTLVEQAEPTARVSVLSTLTPEQIGALSPEQVAALA